MLGPRLLVFFLEVQGNDDCFELILRCAFWCPPNPDPASALLFLRCEIGTLQHLSRGSHPTVAILGLPPPGEDGWALHTLAGDALGEALDFERVSVIRINEPNAALKDAHQVVGVWVPAVPLVEISYVEVDSMVLRPQVEDFHVDVPLPHCDGVPTKCRYRRNWMRRNSIALYQHHAAVLAAGGLSLSFGPPPADFTSNLTHRVLARDFIEVPPAPPHEPRDPRA